MAISNITYTLPVTDTHRLVRRANRQPDLHTISNLLTNR